MASICNLRTTGNTPCRYHPAKDDCSWHEALAKIFCVDAFTGKPYSGNPAAVCLLAAPVEDEWMKSVAREMNLSETAFVEKTGDNEYNLRWFTPTTEVDLCGHATLAAAHILWTATGAGEGSITFNTRSGALIATPVDTAIELDFPLVRPEPSETPKGLLEALGIGKAVSVLKAGADYLVEVDSESAVKNLRPDFTQLGEIKMRGVIVTAPSGDANYDFVSRFFAPGAGIDEDPVTGSAHCALGPYWAGKLGKTEFAARQVSERGGEVGVSIAGDRVILTGEAVTVWEGAVKV